MANMIRRDNREVARNRADYNLDPFRVMNALLRFDPFRDDGNWLSHSGEMFIPHFEVKETRDAYVIRGDLPGVKESDLEMSVTGNVLSISGRREDEHREEGDQYHTMERSYGQFTRTFSLPDGADAENVRAELKDGVLAVHVGKKPEVQPKKISIGRGGSAGNGGNSGNTGSQTGGTSSKS